MPSKLENFKKKFLDYAFTAVGLESIIAGTIRMANNPPEHLFNYQNLDNLQYQFGTSLVVCGAVFLTYGINRFIKRHKRKQPDNYNKITKIGDSSN